MDQSWYGLTSVGPMARTVADVAAMLAVLARQPVADLTAPAGLRVAMSLRSPSAIARPDEHNRSAVLRAGSRLEGLSHQVTRAEPRYSPLLTSQWTRRWQAGVAEAARDLPLAELEPRTQTMVAKGRRVQRLGGERSGAAAAWRQRMIAWLDNYEVLIMPTVATKPPSAGSMDGRGYVSTLLRSAAAVPYTQVWNLAGLPAAAIPTGIGEDGAPRSVQLIAKPGDEASLLALATQLEQFASPPVG